MSSSSVGLKDAAKRIEEFTNCARDAIGIMQPFGLNLLEHDFHCAPISNCEKILAFNNVAGASARRATFVKKFRIMPIMTVVFENRSAYYEIRLQHTHG